MIFLQTLIFQTIPLYLISHLSECFPLTFVAGLTDLGQFIYMYEYSITITTNTKETIGSSKISMRHG